MELTNLFCFLLYLSWTPGLVEAVFLSNGDEDYGNAGLTTTEVVQKYGYTAEEHNVLTEDGYILKLHRMPFGRTKSRERRGVVLLQHGLASSSALWVTRAPLNSLAFLLVDNGYDVWMGNARGNRYSSKNIRITSADPEFWDFSWDIIGYYDMSTMIDYITTETKQESIYYVGHSMGNNMAMVLLSTRPEYNKKFKHIFALAPAIFVEDMRSPVLVFLCRYYSKALESFGPQQWLPPDLLAISSWKYCDKKYPTSSLCYKVYELSAGPSSDVDTASFPAIFSNIVTSTSLKVFRHFGQAIDSGRFRPYDYGEQVNKMYYRAIEPPDYNLKAVTVPVSIFYSDNDDAVRPKNALRLSRILRNVTSLHRIPLKNFNHYDFCYGRHARDLVFNEILSILKKY